MSKKIYKTIKVTISAQFANKIEERAAISMLSGFMFSIQNYCRDSHKDNKVDIRIRVIELK